MSARADLQTKRRSLLERIARKAAEMRQLQIDYFRSRSTGTLHASKAAERELDILLRDLAKVDGQLAGRIEVEGSLFGGTS